MSKPRLPEIQRVEDVTVVSLGAEYENLDEGSVREVRDVLVDVAESANPPLVLLDLSATTFFGSSFLEALFRTRSKINERQGRFGVCSLSEYCAEVVTVTHLDRLIEVYPDAKTGVAALQQPAEG